MIRMQSLCAIGLAALGMAGSAAAQTEPVDIPLTRAGVNLVFEAHEHDLTVPLPDWLTAAERLAPNMMALVETNYYADGGQAFIEFFPKGQSIDNWQTIYAARISTEGGRSLEDYRNAAIYGYSQPCKPEATGVFLFGEETPDFFPPLGFVCGAFRDEVPGHRGLGELMVAVFLKTESGIAMVYQEWKGPAFNPADPATWPIDRESYQARADQLQQQAELAFTSD